MKRWLTMLGLVMVLLTAGAPAAAHSLNLVAALSFQEGNLAVRLLDPYGVAVGGGQVSVVVPQGGSRGSPVILREASPGIYTGALAAPGGGEGFDLRLEAVLGADLYRLELKGLTAASLLAEERQEPMLAVEPKGFPWGAILYGTAVVMLGAATTVAVVRRRSQGPEARETGT